MRRVAQARGVGKAQVPEQRPKAASYAPVASALADCFRHVRMWLKVCVAWLLSCLVVWPGMAGTWRPHVAWGPGRVHPRSEVSRTLTATMWRPWPQERTGKASVERAAAAETAAVAFSINGYNTLQVGPRRGVGGEAYCCCLAQQTRVHVERGVFLHAGHATILSCNLLIQYALPQQNARGTSSAVCHHICLSWQGHWVVNLFAWVPHPSCILAMPPVRPNPPRVVYGVLQGGPGGAVPTTRPGGAVALSAGVEAGGRGEGEGEETVADHLAYTAKRRLLSRFSYGVTAYLLADICAWGRAGRVWTAAGPGRRV